MNDKLIYIHLSKGRIVETRMEIPTKPPMWGDALDDWTAYTPNTEGKAMSDKTILETVYSTAEDLHKAGFITDELLQMFEVITKSQSAEIEQLRRELDQSQKLLSRLSERLPKKDAEIERLQAEVDQLKFNRDIDEVGYDGTVMSDE